MRLLSIRIGSLLLALSASAVLWTSPVSGAGSTSYQLQNNFPNDATLGGGNATSYSIQDNAMTWNELPLASTSYQLQTVTAHTNASAGGSGAGSTGGSGGDTGGSGPAENRRPRPESSSSSSVTSSVSTSSSTAQSSDASSSVSSSIASEQNLSSSASAMTASSIHPAAPQTPNMEEVTDIFSPILKKVESIQKPADLSFFNTIDRFCGESVHPAPSAVTPPTETIWLILIIAILILGIPALMDGMRALWIHARQKKGVRTRLLHVLIALLLTVTMLAGTTSQWIGVAHALDTTPHTHAYNGRLLDSAGNPVTSAVSIRFSYWTSADYDSATDAGAGGSINAGATHYAGWQEVQTVTPNASGYFSVELGSTTALPDFSTLPAATLLSLFLQVEVKPSASADTAYELLDSDPTDTTKDRSGILSVPFALNADTIDQREVGTSSGSIALLSDGGKFKKSVIPGGTNEGTFTLDADNTEASAVTLKFGDTLSKTLTYDVNQGAFVFNDDVVIQGNLTVGLVNGIDITSLGSSVDVLRATNGGGLSLLVAGGSYRLNNTVVNFAGASIAMNPSTTNYVFFGSGGLTKNSTGFPSDETYVPVAEVVTGAGTISSISDRRIMNNDTREHTVSLKFNPAFDKVSFQADGTNNVGQLTLLHDDINLKNYYRWTSTQSTLQDYDLLVHIALSPSFVRWLQTTTENPISFTYRTSSASALNNKIDIQIYDTSGVPITLSGSVSDLANTNWTTSEIEFTGVPTWTAGQDMMVRIRGFAKDNFEAQISSLKLNYITLGE